MHKARLESVRLAVLFLSLLFILAGLVLDNGALLKALINNVDHSFLPGF